MVKLNYNLNVFKELLYYNEESYTGLSSIKTGKPVGSLDYDKFGLPKSIRCIVKGQRYLVHRVIWFLLKGECPEHLDIDHIDGNPFNNKIENLRLVTKKENQRNRSKHLNNKTGVNGVGIHTTSNNSGGYNTYVRATWVNQEGKALHKDFNIKYFESIEDAIEFAALYRSMLITDVHTYTDSHGNRESKRKVTE